MSDDWRKNVIPPPPEPSIVADPADVLALRVIVGVLIGYFARREAHSGYEPAQSIINDLSAMCQEALLSATIDPPDSRMEKLRREALEKVNAIVAAAQFDDGRPGSN